ncbi:MAG: AAA family ATPase [Spirochaetota bacterium]|nr:AAA family ATPase [Spirochaetota bacterium]
MVMERHRVSADRLRWQCDPDQLHFTCTEELPSLEEFIGQSRAIEAIRFGLEMNRSGYNIYVAGLTGTGKTTAVQEHIKRLINERQDSEESYHPDDWCYVYNFDDPDQPQILKLPQGMGKTFSNQMSTLLLRLKEELGKAFSSEEYGAARGRIVEEGQNEERQILDQLEKSAQSEGFLLQITPTGPLLIPMTVSGTMSRTDYLSLPEEQRKVLDEKRDNLMKQMGASFDRFRESEKNMQDRLRELDRNIGENTIHSIFHELLNDFRHYYGMDRYLKGLQAYTLEYLGIFKQQEAPAQAYPGMPNAPIFGEKDPFLPFKINLFVDNSETVGPPVIVESNPTYINLFAKVEMRFSFGGYLSDHTMIKAGSLSRANGGYLLLNIRDVLMRVGVWEALKRAIRIKEVRVENPYEQFGFIAPVGMRPEPMPVNVKIILIGDNYIYHMLSEYDEEFWELFRVKAEFDSQVDRSPDNMQAYACFIANCCKEEKLLPFDSSGVAKMLEYAARMVADQQKLSSRFGQLKELLLESDYWAVKAGVSLISAEHVQRAFDEKIFRHNLIDERMREHIDDGTVMIDVEGFEVGHVNGLSVYNMGDIMFGRPSRISAKTFMGRSGVINIERESELSGRIHNKGVMILSGYLGWKYAQEKPLSLSASLCFEQSYQGIEGDSASSTELYAILSSLSGVPLKQGIAVTGSVNQTGEVQPIGGVNYKIEGFYKVCKARGLTGEQGVMIPHTNIRNLMLHEEIVDAVSKGMFHIYAVKTIDEGIEVLTDIEAGERREDNTYPEGSINYLVNKRLKEIADGLKSYSSGDEEK